MRWKTFLNIIYFVGFGFAFAQNRIEIKKAWLRPAAKEMNTALFFEIRNNSDRPDTLVEASSKISNDVMIHESFRKGKDMMGMREQKFVAVPPKSVVIFKPKSLHVMVMELKEEAATGQRKDFSLKFRKAGTIKVKAVVRDE
jgi:periplasmic copper chaperone A